MRMVMKDSDGVVQVRYINPKNFNKETMVMSEMVKE